MVIEHWTVGMGRVTPALAGIVGALAAAAAATAQDQPAEAGEQPAAEPPAGIVPLPDYSGDFWTRPRVTGDWGGARTDLAEKGFTFDLNWTQYVQGVADGGRNRGAEYGGKLDYLAKVDLMRMGLVPGGLVTVRAETRYGSSVNADTGALNAVNLDHFFPLKGVDDSIPFTITTLSYTQFLSEQFGVFAGKFDTLDGDFNEFASGRGVSQFMNLNFVFNPTGVLTIPYSTLGFGGVWMPIPAVTVSTSLFNTTDSSTTTGFGDIGDGWSWSAAAMGQYRLGDLPGGQSLAFVYAGDGDYVRIGSARFVPPPVGGLAVQTDDDSWCVMWNLWQYVFVEEPGEGLVDLQDGRPDHQGLGVFTRLGFADEDTNPLEWALSGGIGGRGAIPGRDDDTYGVGFFYNGIQDTRLFSALGVESAASGFEAFYNVAVAPSVHVTLDLQVVEPVVDSLDTAVVLGLRVRAQF
jgi:porin